jgi:hypothetical protein
MAYREDAPFPQRQPGEMQDLIMECDEIAERLGCKPSGVRSAINWNRPTAPQPDGRVGGVHYWMRENAEKWIKEHRAHE